MPYTPTSWVDNVTALNQTRLNNLEGQYTEASQSRAPNLTTAYVEAGMVATKDGSVATQLDVTNGTAWLLQADSTLRRRTPAASTPGQFTTSTPSTTYHLYLQPDGTFYWNTLNTPAANSLAIANVTTDGSGNILAVTDARPLNTTMLSTMAGALTLPTLTGNVKTTSGEFFWNAPLGGANKTMFQFLPSDTGDNWGLNYITDFSLGFFDATTSKTALRMFNTGAIQTDSGAIATNGSGAISKIGNQATAGSFGVPVVVAQVLDQNITLNGLTGLISYTAPATGLYRVSLAATAVVAGNITAYVNWTDPHTNTLKTSYFVGDSGHVLNAFAEGANTPIATMPQTFWAKTGTIITPTYGNSAVSPNDFATVYIERLA